MTKRFLSTTGIVLVLVAVGYGGYEWAQSPASVSTGLQTQNASDVLGDNTTLTAFNQTYFSTQVPSYLHSKSINETAGRPILGSYLLIGDDSAASDQLAITIGKLGNGTLNEISAVKLRMAQSELYSVTTQSGLPAGGIAFQKNDHSERSAFWQYGNDYVAVVASSTPSRFSEQSDALAVVLSHWQWPGSQSEMLQ